MKKSLSLFLLALIVCISSCDKDDDQNGSTQIVGCTDDTAFNFNPEATEDDGSCIEVIFGCTDEAAYNYNSDANTDDNSCDYSSASLLNGEWVISLLDYEASIDLSGLPIDDPTIQLALTLAGNQITLEGEFQDAGAFMFDYSEFTYQEVLAFSTEEQTIAALLPIPSIPINFESEGSWNLQNNDEELSFIDSNTGLQQVYEVISLTENSVYLKGVLYMSLDALDFPEEATVILDLLGADFQLPISMDLHLERII